MKNQLPLNDISTQLRNEFLTAARRLSTTKKQAIGDVVEWAALSSTATSTA
jgi:hypothetical protein